MQDEQSSMFLYFCNDSELKKRYGRYLRYFNPQEV